MPIGIQTNEVDLNNIAGQTALMIRNACRQAQQLNEYITTIGGATGLEALGFSTSDATSFSTAANYMQTVAAVFFGTAASTPAFNFDNAISILYGGS